MPLVMSGREDTTVRIFEEIWFNEQARTNSNVLVELDMNWLQIGAQRLEQLVDAILASNCNKSLTALMLGHNFLRDEGCKPLKRLLEKNATIRSLQLDHNDITEEGASYLGQALRSNRTLKTIELSRNALGHDGLKAVLDGMKETKRCLRALNITDNGFLPETFAMLSHGLAKNEVPLLSLTVCEGPRMVSAIQGDQLAALIGTSLSRNTTLTSLNLPDNLIGDDGFGDLAECMPYNTSLVHLNLRGNRITSFGASKMGSAISVNSCLQSLDLSANDIAAGSDTNYLIQCMRQNTTLTDVDLSSNLCSGATGPAVAEIMAYNHKLYAERNTQMHRWVSEMGANIETKLAQQRAAADQARRMIEKQRHAAALLQPLILGAAAGGSEEADAADTTPSTPGRAASAYGPARLYPCRPTRLYLHRNDPRRCGRGTCITLPTGKGAEALWTFVFERANRLIEFQGWPGKCLYLDGAVRWTSEDGLQEVLPRGAEIFARHLPFLQDGTELVVSDGKGDGQGCIKKFLPRGSSAERRHKHRILYVRDQPRWSLAYWRLFVRFYRYRTALLERYEHLQLAGAGRPRNASVSSYPSSPAFPG
jgi:hypothetical protein